MAPQRVPDLTPPPLYACPGRGGCGDRRLRHPTHPVSRRCCLVIPWWNRAAAAAPIYDTGDVVAIPPADQVPRVHPWLTDAQVDILALALHERRHICAGGYSETACARLSGAFDDVYAIEPELRAMFGGA